MDLPAHVGRYEVELLVGDTGLWRVLLARDPVLGRQVVVKVLRDDLGLAAEVRDRLVDRLRLEARAVAVLSHPALVSLHDMGQDDAGRPFLVFELVHGPTLRERLSRAPLAPIEVASIARVVGAALAHGHAAGVVHRDVTPENVVLTKTGPRIADFAVARVPDAAWASLPQGAATPAYTAPEAIRQGGFSAYSDQFALATTLYEALTGLRAFPGDDATAVAASVEGTKHSPPTRVSPALRGFIHLDAIFDRALAKDPRSRFTSAEAFGDSLAAELEGTNMLAFSPPPPSSIVPRATRRWQNAVAAAGVLVIAVLILLGRLQHPEGDNLSLRGVATSFASAIAVSRSSAKPAPPRVDTAFPVPPSAGASSPSAVRVDDASAPALTERR